MAGYSSNSGNNSAAFTAPPPYLSSGISASTSLAVYTSTTLQPTASSSSHVAQMLTINSSSTTSRVRYSIAIPKKREGWKAEVCRLSEKERKELRYEVRREPLSRRFDFRDPQGNHNVMFPSNSLSHKSYLLEAPDGQKLMWWRSSAGWELLSTPSQTVVAQYINADRGHRQQSTPDQQLLGSLEIMALPTDTEPTLLDRKQRRNTNMSNSSTSSSEGGPRLGRAYQRCSVGLGIPAIICAAIASPYASAGMSKQSILGDELANLGRTEIKTFSNDVSVERKGPVLVSGATWDQSSDIRKSSDPRPRKVDLDLIVSSFVAVLAG